MVKYIDIADDIRAKIKEQTYTYGQKLPYEYALCVLYHCNKETMKKALDILVKEGLIVRRRGAGTFVKDYNPDDDVTSYFDHKTIGLTAKYKDIANITSNVINFEVVPCDEFIAKKLQIEEGSFVYQIIRQRLMNQSPHRLEICYMPISTIPNLKLEHLQGSLYHYIQDTLGLTIQSAHKTITAKLSTTLEQDYLELKKGEPFIQIEQVIYLNSGVIFEYSMVRYHYKNFEYKTISLIK